MVDDRKQSDHIADLTSPNTAEPIRRAAARSGVHEDVRVYQGTST